MPLNDDQLRAIGRIAVQAAELEFTMHTLVSALVNPSNINIGFLAFARDQFSSMQHRALRLSEELAREDYDLAERIRRWAGEAKKLQERRNEILHAIWVMDQPTGTMVAVRLSRRHAPQAETPVTELDSLADTMTAAVREGNELFSALVRER
jgi:hypothetical protein